MEKNLLIAILIVCGIAAIYLMWYALPYIIVLGGLGFAVYHLYLKDKMRDPFDD